METHALQGFALLHIVKFSNILFLQMRTIGFHRRITNMLRLHCESTDAFFVSDFAKTFQILDIFFAMLHNQNAGRLTSGFQAVVLRLPDTFRPFVRKVKFNGKVVCKAIDASLVGKPIFHNSAMAIAPFFLIRCLRI